MAHDALFLTPTPIRPIQQKGQGPAGLNPGKKSCSLAATLSDYAPMPSSKEPVAS
jgi:hypothetical protein